MKKELIKIVLIASLALNLAFVSSGFFKKTGGKKDSSGREYVLNGDYELNEDQKAKLNDVVKNFRIKLVNNKSSVLEKRIDIIEMLGDPEFITESLDEELKKLNEIEAGLNSEFVSTLLEISTILDSGQWIKFLYNLSKGWFFTGIDTSP